ncbi:MAG: hypothetical protein H7X92_10525 [Chitinophagales bacterium]|nr:hypothetical protein [Hyphomicrobiales bacterium]
MSWFHRLQYRNAVLAEMMAIHILTDNRFQEFLKHYFPGALTAINKGYQDKQNITELAITLSGAVIAATIEALHDDRCKLFRKR